MANKRIDDNPLYIVKGKEDNIAILMTDLTDDVDKKLGVPELKRLLVGNNEIASVDDIFGVSTNLDNGDYDIANLLNEGRYTWTVKVPAGINIEGRTTEDNEYGSLTVTKVGSGNDRKQVVNFGIDNSQFSRTNPGGSNPWGSWKQTITSDECYTDKKITLVDRGGSIYATDYANWLVVGKYGHNDLWRMNNVADVKIGDIVLIQGVVSDRTELQGNLIARVTEISSINSMKADSIQVIFTPNKDKAVGDETMYIAPKSNEVNFGGKYSRNRTIYFGFSEEGGRLIPTEYIFGNAENGSAVVRAKNFFLDGVQVATTQNVFTPVCDTLTENDLDNAPAGTTRWTAPAPAHSPNNIEYGTVNTYYDDLIEKKNGFQNVYGLSTQKYYYRSKINGSWRVWHEVTNTSLAQTTYNNFDYGIEGEIK